MGKKRSKTPDNLPPKVYVGRSRYYHEGKGTRKITMLCSLDAPIENVWRSYQALVLDANEPGLSTFWNLAQMWMADTKSEAKRTRKKIADATAVYRRRRVETKTSPIMIAFGDKDPNEIRTLDVQLYMGTRYQLDQYKKVVIDEDGDKVIAADQANKERGIMSQIFDFGLRKGFCNHNPIKAVQKHKVGPRDRYISDDEFLALHSAAPGYIQTMMELSYCCALRLEDVFNLQIKNITADGLLCKDSKASETKKKEVFSLREWTTNLKEAIAKVYNPAEKVTRLDRHLILKNGRHPSPSSFKRDWKKTREAVNPLFLKQGQELHLVFHDIKAKSISDFEGTDSVKLDFSGHSSIKIMKVYDRKNDAVKRASLVHNMRLK